jgi:hypothetical protein
MTRLDYGIWVATLVVVAVIIVPVAVSLLGRAVTAARAIERYLADILVAGVQVADHTGTVPALDQTIQTAVAMKPVAQAIEAKTAAVAALLAQRAQKVAR